jgi:5-methylcytosine-specific restriction protein A
MWTKTHVWVWAVASVTSSADAIVTDLFLKSSAWRTVRVLALKRDHYRCVKCGEDVSHPGKSRVDHIKPRSTHPHLALALFNLRTLCGWCDNQAHREKRSNSKTGERQERFVIHGVSRDGTPLDPNHFWNRR